MGMQWAVLLHGRAVFLFHRSRGGANYIFAMRYFLSTVCAFLGLMATVAMAQNPSIEKPMFSGPGVGLGATVTAMSMDSIYGRILQYNFQYMALAELEAIEMRLDDRVDWEFHLGAGAYEPRQMYKVAFVGCKLNLTDGKMVDARRLQSRLHKLKSYLELGGLRGWNAPALAQRVDSMEQEVQRYNERFWWKRVGVAFWVPLYGDYRYTEKYSSPANDSLIYERERVVTASHALYQDFSKSVVALTYDLGDKITLSAGATLQRKLFLGASLDVSTPISDFLAGFRSEAKSLRTPAATNLGLSID